MKKILVAVLVLAMAAGGWVWWTQRNAGAEPTLRFSGNVDIRQVALAFDASGRLTRLAVQEGDRVAAGDVIALIDMGALELEAKAQEALVEAQHQALLKLQSGARAEEVLQARATLASAQAAERVAQQEFDRLRQLALSKSAAFSTQGLEQAEAALEQARAAVAQHQAGLDLLLAGPRPEEIAGAEAQLRAAQAKLDLLHYQIAQGVLQAPQAGVIRSRLREQGDMVTPQTPVYALALTDPKWVRIYVSQPDLGRIVPGMAAEVLSDSFPDAPVAGQVGYIASVAEFTPKAVQTDELRSSLVYEVHVTVDDPADRLRLGQPVTVTLRAAP
ncbi:MAG: HlyD family efflux transporter periplasmic adaptor subunit [Paracoccaceae bacterium]